MKIKTLLNLFIGIFIFLPTTSFAAGNFDLSVIGEMNPFNTVTVKITSPYLDVGGTKILWLENGEIVEEGVGMITHKVSLRDIGSSISLTAILGIPGSGGEEKQTIILSPATMDVIWEAQTAVPPFYRGKALPSNESLVKTFAIPYFGTTTPSSVVNFAWKKNSSVSIGDGLNIVSAGLFGAWENESVKVSVAAKYGSKTANTSINIPSFKPSILFYEVSPTQNILTNTSLKNDFVNNSVEISVLAVPFGVSNMEREDSKILYEWNAGSKKIKSGQDLGNEYISLSRDGSKLENGVIPISLMVQNTVNVMQYSNNKFSWVFTNK